MPHIDRNMARALVEAGYMGLDRYIEIYGFEADGAAADATVPARSHPRRFVSQSQPPRWKVNAPHVKKVNASHAKKARHAA